MEPNGPEGRRQLVVTPKSSIRIEITLGPPGKRGQGKAKTMSNTGTASVKRKLQSRDAETENYERYLFGS